METDVDKEQQQHKLDPVSDPCPIQRLELDSVKIYADGGNWADFFEGLGHLDNPNLELLRVQELSYFNSHPYSEQPHRPWEDRSILWSGSDADPQALREFLQSKAESATRRQCTMMAQLGGTLLGAKEILEDMNDSLGKLV